MMRKRWVLYVVDPGHNIEKVMIQGVANYMTEACLAAGLTFNSSNRNYD